MAKLIPGMAGAIPRHPLNETLMRYTMYILHTCYYTYFPLLCVVQVCGGLSSTAQAQEERADLTHSVLQALSSQAAAFGEGCHSATHTTTDRVDAFAKQVGSPVHYCVLASLVP